MLGRRRPPSGGRGNQEAAQHPGDQQQNNSGGNSSGGSRFGGRSRSGGGGTSQSSNSDYSKNVIPSKIDMFYEGKITVPDGNGGEIEEDVMGSTTFYAGKGYSFCAFVVPIEPDGDKSPTHEVCLFETDFDKDKKITRLRNPDAGFRIGVLWENESKNGDLYFSGEILGQRVNIWQATDRDTRKPLKTRHGQFYHRVVLQQKRDETS